MMTKNWMVETKEDDRYDVDDGGDDYEDEGRG
jgi:hypothetical protein